MNGAAVGDAAGWEARAACAGTGMDPPEWAPSCPRFIECLEEPL